MMISTTTCTAAVAIICTLALALASSVEGFASARRSSTSSSCISSTRIYADADAADDSDDSDSLLDAILWDMDGVLAETERDAHRVAFNTVFKERQLDTEWTTEGYGALLEVGGGKERMTAHWNAVGWPETSSGFFADTADDEVARQARVKELHLAKTDVFNELIGKGTVPLRPGVQRLIDEAIAAGKTLAVCSTSNEKAVINLVKTLLGDDRATKFTIFAGDVVDNKKPSPDIYNLAVDTLKLDKSRCLIVEDSGIGWGAAKAAGICCIVTKSVYTAHEDFTGADLIVTDLDGTDGASNVVTLETVEGLLQKRL